MRNAGVLLNGGRVMVRLNSMVSRPTNYEELPGEVIEDKEL
jgi:hypothetical protein